MKKLLSAVLALIMLIMCAGCSPVSEDVRCDRVSLYLSEESRVISLSYEDYLVGCIFGWVSLSAFPSVEALRAVAVAANTLTQYHLRNTPRAVFCGADLSDSAECQPYMSPEAAGELYGSSYPVYLERVREAAGYGQSLTLTYEGEPIYAAMCAVSTGQTDSDGRPYLAARDCPSDKLSDAACDAYSANAVRMALTELTGISRVSGSPEDWFTSPVYTNGGTLREIRFCGARVTGQQLREVFSLRSAAVTVEYAEERFLLRTRGVGDNLGMSISEAGAMAESGCTAAEILLYFYSPALMSNS